MKDLLKIKANSPMQKAQQLVELEVQYKLIKARIDEYKAELLKTTQELDVLSLKTGGYTITRVKRVTPVVENFEALKRSLDKENIPFQTKVVFDDNMKLVFKMLIEEGRMLPGLGGSETEYIMVRVREDK